MACKKRVMGILSIFIILLLFSITTNAEQKQKLPRSYGPLYLGMSVKEFKKIADVEMGQCVHCAEGELHAVLTVDEKTAKFFETTLIVLDKASLKYQPTTLQPEDATCFFYKEILYKIEMHNIKGYVESIKNRYVKALGEPTTINVWDTGISKLTWEDSSTSLEVLYSTEQKGIGFSLIVYTDLKILKQVPKEKGCGEEEDDSNKKK